MLRTLIFVSAMLITSICRADCFDMAGRDYKIDPDLLRAVAWTESEFRTEAVGINPGSGFGLSFMQIDSQNFPHLRQFGITPQMLRADPCMNIYTGAYFLAIAVKRWGMTWRAVGAYNAGFADTPRQENRRRIYAEKVFRAYSAIRSGAQKKEGSRQRAD